MPSTSSNNLQVSHQRISEKMNFPANNSASGSASSSAINAPQPSTSNLSRSELEDQLKSLSKTNRILKKQLMRSQKTRAELEIMTEAREKMIKQALRKVDTDRCQLAEAKIQLTTLNQKLANRIEIETAALSEATDNLQLAKVQVVKSEKFSALGELVAGVAHEINNPIGCITSNLKFVQEYGEQLLQHIELQHSVLKTHESKLGSNSLEEIEDHADDIDLDYIIEDFPKLIESMVTSGDRIKKISQSLRTFARADTTTKQPYDLHKGIDGTVLILRHRLKAVGDKPAIIIQRNYGELSPIQCYPGQINQVFMNILANAIDAMEEGEKPSSSPKIDISTAMASNQIIITITDNAGGMSESVQSRIFESQFTTKTAGKGTGLGLSIAYQIVTDTHQGQLECTSTLGIGTTFRIVLPRS